ncbi:hypothetical protein ACH5RR_032509 [Cinchona calisaya]|uniref:Uncharacterized protein n=1 Tax=Cinchona calisaya TaxID=153742 RepID=A0ABD2YLF5_9GENT
MWVSTNGISTVLVSCMFEAAAGNLSKVDANTEKRLKELENCTREIKVSQKEVQKTIEKLSKTINARVRNIERVIFTRPNELSWYLSYIMHPCLAIGGSNVSHTWKRMLTVKDLVEEILMSCQREEISLSGLTTGEKSIQQVVPKYDIKLKEAWIDSSWDYDAIK